MLGQFSFPRPSPYTGTFAHIGQARKAAESQMLARTAINKARAAALLPPPPGQPQYAQQLARQALLATEVASSEARGLAPGIYSAYGQATALGPAAPLRRQAIAQVAREEWAATVRPQYRPTPEFTPEQQMQERKRAVFEWQETEEARPTPEYFLEEPPGEFIPPDFYQGEPGRPLPGPPLPRAREEEPAVEEPTDNREDLIKTLTIVSLVIGIIAFFR